MKRLSISLLLAMLSVILFSSCEKEEKHGDVCFKATTERYTPKDMGDKVTYDGSIFAWEQDDQIKVYRKEISQIGSRWNNGLYSATYLPTTNPGYAGFTFVETSGTDVTTSIHSGDYYAICPASAATSDMYQIKMPATQVLNADGKLIGFPMCAKSNITTLQFKNLFGLLKLHLTKSGVSVSSIKITAQGFPLNGTYEIDYDTYVIRYVGTLNGVSQTVTLSLSSPQDISNGKDFYIAMPPGDYTNLRITIFAGGYRSCTKVLKPNITFNVQRNMYSTISLGEDDLAFPTEGIVGSVFSINNQGGHVVFSKGNLQYQAASTPANHAVVGGGTSRGIWRFAEHQYDFVGNATYGNVYVGDTKCNNLSISPNYSGWIDLFGWGTSGYDNKYPYLTSATVADYYSGSIASTYYDWGQYNAISNGGDTPCQWRVLTQEEMSYILTGRDVAYSFAKVFVNGVRGLILFPDDFEWPSQLTLPYGLNDRTFAFNNNEISHLDNSWQSLESAGAVFLPQTGQRNPTAFSNETQGLYWLSNYSSNNGASYFSIKLADITYNTNTSRYYGYAVRLVHDVE